MGLRRRLAAAAVAFAWASCLAGGPVCRPAGAQELVADLSEHLIAISTDFTGAEVVLFGAVEEAGDVAIVVRGPPQTVTVRRKAKIVGIWLNRDAMTFADVPSYYSLASSQPVESYAERARARHEIGLDFLRLDPREVDAPEPEQVAFREALVAEQQAAGVYAADVGQVSFLGSRLFRTNIRFPANVPTGVYTVEVLLFRDGEVVSAQTTPLIVSKIGVGAQISRFAQTQAAGYGALAIVVAVLAGWLASAAFRRV